MDKEYIAQLLELYFKDEATHKQREELFDELQKGYETAEWEELLMALAKKTACEKSYNPTDWEATIRRIIQQQAKVVPINKKRHWWRIPAAAAVFIFVAIGFSYWIFFHKKEPSQVGQKPVAASHNDVLPGQDGAILTLSSGRKIVLDSTMGNIASEGGVKVINKDGSVSYSPVTDDQNAHATVYNIINTPKKRQYQLMLADGSKVWLNAASSIRFPTAFKGKERMVEVTGEAYFEVARDALKPFIVAVNGMKVEVLGTQFNINAYGDEHTIKTTLLEGKVRIRKNENTAVLEPGEQAIATINKSTSANLTIDRSPNINKIVAWKDNRFYFQDDNIKTIMRQLERWYDVSVVYDSNISTQYTGIIGRDETISKVLEMFQKLGDIKFTIEGTTIHVKKLK